jgi:hypothetical protein
MTDDLSEKLERLEQRIVDARSRERAAVERANETDSTDMNVRIRSRLAPSWTVHADDPDATKTINANIRAAAGRGVLDDATDVA